MKNITVSVPDDVYRTARITAAQRGSSVSALVADYLGSLSEQEAEFERLRRQQHEVVAGIKYFSASENIDRDALHARAIR